MSYELNISAVASLLTEPARSAMLTALLDRRALPAGELAHASGITPQTASTHLAKLLDGHLITVEKEGLRSVSNNATRQIQIVSNHLSRNLQ